MTTWALDPAHSQVQFSVKHMAISTVRGTFDGIAGTIDETDGSVTDVLVDIDVASINTGNDKRDEHLRSADFFDVANFPKATFKLAQFTRNGDDISAEGELTLRGVTRPVTLTGEVGGPGTDPWGATRMSASMSTKISRKDWGLTWNVALEAGGVLVSDEVKLSVEVEATQVAPDQRTEELAAV